MLNAGSAIAGPSVDLNTGPLTWDLTGALAGETLIVQVRGNDGQLTDTGTITINVAAPTAPEPMSALLLGAGLLGLGVARRRRSR